jgi:hypothetical protein
MPEKFSDKPEEVQAAIAEGDTERLRAMGRKGAKVAAENKVYAKATKDAHVEDIVENDLHALVHGPGVHIENEEGDVLPDGDVSEKERNRYVVKRAHAVFNLEAKPKKR